MTRKQQLNLLQKLHSVAEISEYRELFAYGSPNDVQVAHIAERAGMLFFQFTEMLPCTVSMTELNNARPSPRVAEALAARQDRWRV